MTKDFLSTEQSRGGRRLLLAAAVALSCGVLARAGGFEAATLATYGFESAGWATFGLALPPGAATHAVKVGDWETQTDVKRRWPDGSIRFAVVTVNATTAGNQPLVADAAGAGEVVAGWPNARVTLSIAGTDWIAAPPVAGKTVDAWLTGPLVSEHRVVVAPEAAGKPHPFLRVVFDIRAYADQARRIDITVENVLDIPDARTVTYDAAITLDGATVWQRRGVRHAYMARWRQVFGSRLSEATIVPDLRTAVLAKAVPDYLPLITPGRQAPEGLTFELFGSGSLNPDMRSHGGRSELAPYPDWAARYLAHPDPQQRRYVLAHGDIGGSFPMHLREPESGRFKGLGRGRFVSIDERNRFWMDPRAPRTEQPAGTDEAGALIPDNAHVPSLAFIPYLLTGDRFYADEMTFWVNYALLRTIPDAYSGGFTCRGETASGSRGLLRCNETRGIAWVLRNMADAAAHLPDGDPAVAYFADKVRNNLKDLDDLARRDPTPLGTQFYTWMRGSERPDGSRTVGIATWENNYVAWAIDRANDVGFRGGLVLRDVLARWQVGLFTAGEEFPREHAGNSTYVVGTLVDPALLTGRVRFFTSLREVYQQNALSGTRATPFPGYYGVDARLMLLIGMREGWPGAREGYDYVHQEITADLAKRAGWAIAPQLRADARTEVAQ